MYLNEFLVNAKKSGYAGGGEYKILDDGGKEFIYEEGELKYRDRFYEKYYAHSGQEIVWIEEIPIWSMNYVGMMTSLILPKYILPFLKEALFHVEKSYPFRGPFVYENDKLKYVNEIENPIKNLTNHVRGVERIFYKTPKRHVKERRIYYGYYHGLQLEGHELDKY